MPVVNELIRSEADGAISFGNYKLDTKSKLPDFEHCGDTYKVKTFNEITKLEKNGSFVYESVPGTAVNDFKATDTSVSFMVEGDEDAQITLGLEEGTSYDIRINDKDAGTMATNMGGKLVLSVEFTGLLHIYMLWQPFLGGYMAKAKNTAFFCKECGYESVKWFGQCPACKEWNTFVEEPVSKPKSAKGIAGTSQRAAASSAPVPVEINSVSFEENDRTSTGIAELDRVLGGGIVAGSLVLVGGDPGIGKSTLLLQMCYNLSAAGKDVLYISGEESLKQIKLRADRIGKCSGTLKLLCETSLDNIEDILARNKPGIVIIDSIQTMYKEDVAAAPGSVSQVRETTSILMQLAKGLNITIFIVGHVTKEGTVAGPRMLEHMVDTVLYFEGDRYASYRILRGVKNRFGSTNEIGVFEMQQSGLSEVENPSEYMLNGRPENASGSVVVCLLEGTRPIMVEIQALVCDSNFGMARRTAAGTDYNRVNLLMAVLEKRAGIHMSGSDAYVNVAGGIKVSEPALDLGIVMALVSSFKNRAIDEKTVIFGEVGLAGEVRAVSQAQQRVNEAVKLGFKTCILPGVCLKNIKKNDKIEIIGVNNVQEAIKLI